MELVSVAGSQVWNRFGSLAAEYGINSGRWQPDMVSIWAANSRTWYRFRPLTAEHGIDWGRWQPSMVSIWVAGSRIWHRFESPLWLWNVKEIWKAAQSTENQIRSSIRPQEPSWRRPSSDPVLVLVAAQPAENVIRPSVRPPTSVQQLSSIV